MCQRVCDGLTQYICSADLEVQDRASSALQLVQYLLTQIKEGENVASLAADVKVLFSGELNPVAPKAQRKVQIPEGYIAVQFFNNLYIIQYYISFY